LDESLLEDRKEYSMGEVGKVYIYIHRLERKRKCDAMIDDGRGMERRPPGRKEDEKKKGNDWSSCRRRKDFNSAFRWVKFQMKSWYDEVCMIWKDSDRKMGSGSGSGSGTGNEE
jgi:hypothetical protein